jgi:glycerol-3-phosphate acyltransferase PlsY
VTIVFIALCFLAGSFPTAYLVGRARGVDIRTVGSGNVGATNVFRVLGRGAGVFTLTVDVLKGLVPVLILEKWSGVAWAPAAGAVAAVLGHSFSPFIKFRGGKGVATSAGAFLALLPLATLAALLVFLLLFSWTRIVSVGSLGGAAVLPAVAFVVNGPSPAAILAAAVSFLIVVRHIPNIKRLLRGEERSFKK